VDAGERERQLRAAAEYRLDVRLGKHRPITLGPSAVSVPAAEAERINRQLAPLCLQLGAALGPVDGYVQLCDASIVRTENGERWHVDPIDRDSCRAVWFEVHKDLIATLGWYVARRTEEPSDWLGCTN
jgi:hypothetical protein